MPGWTNNLSGSALESAMKNHVTNVATHFRGKVASWDVVNEAFGENGERRSDSPLQQKLGDGYIETAFRAARAADPTAKLCINDYNTDAINSKSTAIYNLVRDFKARGVPIDCVGFQSHLIIGQVPSSMQQNLQRFADLGVDVRITELDIRMTMPSDSAKLATQAADYKKVFQICLAVSRCQGVTIWGITDKYSWVPACSPGRVPRWCGTTTTTRSPPTTRSPRPSAASRPRPRRHPPSRRPRRSRRPRPSRRHPR